MMNCELESVPGSSNLEICCDFKNKLDLSKLCARCAKICWLKSKKIWVDEIRTNNECAQKIEAHDVHAGYVSTNGLCAQDATINKLCVKELNAPNWKPCNKIRAYAGFNADFDYVLGDDVGFDMVYDDPSSGISFVPTTHYTAPVSGYYEVSVFLNISDLSGTDLIVGVPVSAPALYVNGIARDLSYVSFLAFSGLQSALIDCTVLLAAGDELTVRYNVIVLDPVLGQKFYVGNVNLKGGGFALGAVSTLSVVLLTDLCEGGTPVQCIPCQPVEIPCEPVHIDGCEPRHEM